MQPPEKNAKEPGSSADLIPKAIDPDEAIAEEKTKYKNKLAEEQRRNCELGKQNLARLETFARIRVLAEDREYRYLSPEEIIERKKKSRETIIAYCD